MFDFFKKKATNVGVAHGVWGENVAVEHLRRNGYEILERNVRPVKKDARLEIDIIAYDHKTDTMVFVEVKQHAKLSPHARRLQSVDARKRQNMRRACNAWRRVNKWHGGCRFDVVEVYGIPQGGRPIVDHIANVRLFVQKERFVKWSL